MFTRRLQIRLQSAGYHATRTCKLLIELEAPPGFEPGIETKIDEMLRTLPSAAHSRERHRA